MRLLSLTPMLLLIACGGKTDDTDGSATDTGSADSGSTSDTGSVENDADGDGVSADEDCDDNDASIFPGAEELCDEVDNNCDDVVDEGFDADGDGYWSADECEFGDDCDDSESSANPNGTEIPYDGIDQDCVDGDLVDVDGDGFDSDQAGGDDCDDDDSAINPDAEEIPKNDIDEDCNGVDSYDGDADGYDDEDFGGEDCDDEDPSVNPDAIDWMNDGVDSNCDGPDGDEVSLDDTSVMVLGITDTNGIPDYAGYDVELCDLDADGIGDILVNAPFSTGYEGRTGIFYGSGSANWNDSMALSTADTLIAGDTGDFIGWGSSCGDFDGDGYDDLSITTGEIYYYPTQGGYDADLRVLVYNGNGGTFDASLDPSDADVIINAKLTVPEDAVVYSFNTHFHDIDGDGAAEILGVYGNEIADRFDGAQQAIVIPGGEYSGEIDLEDFDLYGFEPPQAHSLVDFRVLDDMDGDGVSEILFGAPTVATLPQADPDTSDGVVYIHSGLPSSAETELSIKDLATLSIAGDSEDWYLGLRNQTGDFDGDGTVDLVSSAIGESTYAVYSGAVALFSDFGTTLSTVSGKVNAGSLADGMLYGNDENGQLNPLGVNCLRSLPPAGRVIWGARTLQGDDRLASEWKYLPVRRTALFIEESLYRGLQWVVFETND